MTANPDISRLENVRISLFKNVTAKENEPVEVHSILDDIRGGKWQKQIAEVRAEFARGGKDAANVVKKKLLPAVTFTGTFNRRHTVEAFAEHSGILCLDFDDLNGRMAEVKLQLAGDPYCLAIFDSPSKGVKFLTKIKPDANEHKRVFAAATAYFKQKYNLDTDKDGSDISRLCFVSYDPALIHNPDASIFELPPTEKTLPAQATKPRQTPQTAATLTRYVQAAVEAETRTVSTTPNGQRNAALNKAAFNLGQFVGAGALDRADAEQALMAAARSCKLPDQEAIETIQSGLRAGQKEPRQIPEPRPRPERPRGKPPAPSSNAVGILALTKEATLEEIGNALREAATAMKGLDKLSAALAREECFRKLKELNVQAPAKLLAAAFDCDDASNNATAGGGQTITIEDPESWPAPTDGGELLQEIKDTIERYVVIPEQSAIAAALWVLHSHTQDAAFISPFLALLSPEKRCGKTTMLQVVGTLSPRRLFASNITPAALFRAVEKYCPTLMIDEADSFMGENEELRGILNSGHTKTTAFVVRTQGDDHDPAVFSTWCPKIIALIGKLRDTLEDRSIVIPLRRKNPDEIVERLRTDRLKSLEPICRKAWRWGRDNLDALRNHEPEMPSELHDRAADNWRPLLAVAEIIGGKWPEHARHAALALSCRVPEESESIRELLLADIRTLFETRGTDCLFSENLTSVLDEMENRPWPEFSDGKPLTKTKLAKLLKPFGIAPRTVRIGVETAKGYRLEDFQDAFSRYLPPENVTMSQPASLLSETDFSKRHTQEVCDVSESQETPVNIDLLRCDVSKREVIKEPPVAVEDSETSPTLFEEGEI